MEKPLVEVNENPWAYQAVIEAMTDTFWNAGGFGHGDEKREALVRRKLRDHLTTQQRQILFLYFYEGLTERQVAEHMGLTYGQVHTSKKILSTNSKTY